MLAVSLTDCIHSLVSQEPVHDDCSCLEDELTVLVLVGVSDGKALLNGVGREFMLIDDSVGEHVFRLLSPLEDRFVDLLGQLFTVLLLHGHCEVLLPLVSHHHKGNGQTAYPHYSIAAHEASSAAHFFAAFTFKPALHSFLED